MLSNQGASTSESYTLPGVIQHLQQEWRRFERDRNEWEIEKAELKARIIVLEGERRAMEATKGDLLKRIKMLEFALRQERNKRLSTVGQEMPSYAEEGRPSTPGTTQFLNQGSLLKGVYNPRQNRNKSRDLLKLCLEEVDELCSFSNQEVSSVEAGGIVNFASEIIRQYLGMLPAQNELAKKSNEFVPPDAMSSESAFLRHVQTMESQKLNEAESSPRTGMNSITGANAFANSSNKRHTMFFSVNAAEQKEEDEMFSEEAIAEDPTIKKLEEQATTSTTRTAQNEHVSESSSDLPSSSINARPMIDDYENSNSILELSRSSLDVNINQEDSLDEDSLNMKTKDLVEADGHIWRTRLHLRSHLDTVNSIAFDKSTFMLCSGGEDGMVKLWNLEGVSLAPQKTKECEPIATYRGHLGAVKAVQISSIHNLCFSAGVDAQIFGWTIPPPDKEIYSPFDRKVVFSSYIGHSNIIWDLKLHPAQELLASSGADGKVKIWKIFALSPLTHSFAYETEGETDTVSINPTCLDFGKANSNVLWVGFQNSSLFGYDLETGKVTSRMSLDSEIGLSSQVNAIKAHQMDSLLVSGHEDRVIKFFDTNSGKCVHEMKAHLDAVSSVDISPNGYHLASGGHDTTVRCWDLRKYSCIQEFHAHRAKYEESVCCVRYHPNNEDWLASSGADSLIKLYT